MSLLAETARTWSGGIWFELSSLADSEFWFKLAASYEGIHPDFEARLFNEENGTQGWWDLGDFQRQNQPRSKFVTHSLLASSKLVFSDRYRPLQYPKRYFLEPEVEVWLDTIWRWGGAPKEFKRQIREEGEIIWHLLPMCCGLSALVCRTLGNKCLAHELRVKTSERINLLAPGVSTAAEQAGKKRERWVQERRLIVEQYLKDQQPITMAELFSRAGISKAVNGYAALRGDTRRDAYWNQIKNLCSSKQHH